jgi:CubicO group peptidase (beta-lactamase class C family)
MGSRLLFLCVLLVCARTAFAQAVEEGFGGTVLEAPPRTESGALGQVPPTFSIEEPVAEAEAAAPLPPDAARLKGYIDGLMSGLIASGEFPGAVVLIIEDGKVSYKAGYGFADIRARVPVDPDRTRFRVGSISKLITATAVMQLVEQGKADLSADVNTYLSVLKIPATYPEPVTLANILTHTAGFDDRYLGIGAPLSEAAQPLGPYLARTMPPRVLAPGKVIAYSNHAYGLAGHVIETISGEEFNTYVQTNIFAPLGMEASSFGVPYPTPADIAVPYFQGGEEDGFVRAELDRVQFGPAGDLITTAGDIGKFMLAHLNKGTYGDDEQLLSEVTIERMHSQHFAQGEGLDGWAYGFMEGRRNGVRWIGHDGSWLGFCGQLVMVPEKKAGFFVAYNADCRFQASAPLRKSLFDLLWPSSAAIAAEPNSNAEQLSQKLAGTYMSVRRARADFTVMAAAASQLTVKPAGEGKLLVHWPAIGRDLVFVPRANGTWINPDFQMKAAAVFDALGNPTRLAIDADAFDRVAGANDWNVWSVALAFVVVVCLIALWSFVTGSLRTRVLGEPQAAIKLVPRLVGFAAAGMTIVTLVGMSGLLAEKVPLAVVHGPSPALTALASLPALVAVLSLPMMFWSATGFGEGTRARLAQAGYAVLTIAILTFVAFAWQWGFHPFGLSR